LAPRRSRRLTRQPAGPAQLGTIPHATYQELPNQRHDVDAKVLAPVLSDFFCTSAVSR
jgi:hypothetical protein